MIYHLTQLPVNSHSTTICNTYHLRSTQGNVSPLHHFDSSQQSTVSMSPPSFRLFNIHITGDTLTVGAILDLQVLNCALFLAHFQSVGIVISGFYYIFLCHARGMTRLRYLPFRLAPLRPLGPHRHFSHPRLAVAYHTLQGVR